MSSPNGATALDHGRLATGYRGEMTDLQQAMLAQRRVMISGPLEMGLVSAATAQLMFLDGESADPVNVVINSPGGQIEDALPLLDAMRLVQTPLVVDVLGRADGSAGVIVAAAPGTRRLGATASMSLRLSRANVAPGTAEELQRLADAQAKLDQSVAAAVADRTGQTAEWVREQFDRGGVLRGAEAVDCGLVDEIR